MYGTGTAPLETGAEQATDGSTTPGAAPPPNKKPFSFYMSFLALNIMVFIVSLDATVLAVAIPVAFPKIFLRFPPRPNSPSPNSPSDRELD